MSNYLDFTGCDIDLQWFQQRHKIHKQALILQRSWVMQDTCCSKTLTSYRQDGRSDHLTVSLAQGKKKNPSGRFKNKSLFIKVLQFTCTTGCTLFCASHNQRSFLHCPSQHHILQTNSQQWDATQYKTRTSQRQAHPKIWQQCECRLKYAVRNCHQAQTRFQNTKCKSCQRNNH